MAQQADPQSHRNWALRGAEEWTPPPLVVGRMLTAMFQRHVKALPGERCFRHPPASFRRVMEEVKVIEDLLQTCTVGAGLPVRGSRSKVLLLVYDSGTLEFYDVSTLSTRPKEPQGKRSNAEQNKPLQCHSASATPAHSRNPTPSRGHSRNQNPAEAARTISAFTPG
ncbi:hypothetical protein BD289DRAFT_439140 [Coniella lustricola]|uniref:Uncharacterized protein n=1 Tax=Coniella lustricola TaxID=2025994 RepID=A0A2T3A223_9PEZI|nr:hypothetical protein BD289DRAFT_439140 [Coniella lustricola]